MPKLKIPPCFPRGSAVLLGAPFLIHSVASIAILNSHIDFCPFPWMSRVLQALLTEQSACPAFGQALFSWRACLRLG